MNFVICGLPRTGTTIIARFIAALSGVCVLQEPWQAAVFAKSFPPILSPPVDCAHFGFKEPFWAIDRCCQFRNDAVLRAYKRIGWTFVWITRDPYPTYVSMRRWLGPDGLEEFLFNWRAFESFRAGAASIDYDSFCRAPVETWNVLQPLPVRAETAQLAACAIDAFGDECARLSAEVIVPARSGELLSIEESRAIGSLRVG